MRANELLRLELLRMIAEDDAVRQELASDGSLFEGYHPRMELVHRKNKDRLKEIIHEYGWPGVSMVGNEGELAAWRMAQHSIGDPDFLREALRLVQEAAQRGDAPLWQPATMEDRIRMFEGRLQVFGTQFDWDEQGQISPYPAVEDAECVNERRAKVGLGPLEAEISKKRTEIVHSLEKPPKDLRSRREALDAWARSVGWRK